MRKVKDRIKEIRKGQIPGVLDLFCGCGGMTLGFKLAGFRPIAGFDLDKAALETWWHNLRPDAVNGTFAVPVLDISSSNAAECYSKLGVKRTANVTDVIIGGPPCQAYSRIGRGKLRSLKGDNAHLHDDRGSLYGDFLRFVRELAPLAVVVENVPDSVRYGELNIPDEICRKLSRMNYKARWSQLNAAEFGVPQYRERIIIVALHESFGIEPSFPKPTHKIVNQERSRLRTATLRGYLSRRESGEDCRWFIMPPAPDGDAKPAITAQEALDDLPRIFPLAPSWRDIIGNMKLSNLRSYHHTVRPNQYQKEMRNWPDFETKDWVSGQVIRNTPRDFPIFARMKDGDNYLSALKIAEDLFATASERETSLKGRPLTKREEGNLRKQIVPPYDSANFEEKWLKLKRDEPSHTVVAHLRFDTYSHIHYDSEQARGISVREAARLQSFPDGFRFPGNLKEAFSQIGNAVPPLLAAAIGRGLISIFEETEC